MKPEGILMTALVAAAIGALFTAGAPGGARAADCGDVEQPCEVPLGTYNVALPEIPPGSAERPPAVLYFHGAGGSGAGVLKNTAMISLMTSRGYVVIAPNGLKRPQSRFGPGWSFRPEGRIRRDELAFTRQMLDDAAAHFGIDRDRVLMTGFSIGGSLVWYLACKDPQVAAAYAPIAGAFWRPHPADCAGPVDLLHTHGWRDQTVPLEGRPLRSGAIYQGDVFEALQRWRAENGCERLRADSFDTAGAFWRRTWSSCTTGKQLELALHPGNHGVPKGWAKMAIDWFEARLDAAPETQ